MRGDFEFFNPYLANCSFLLLPYYIPFPRFESCV